MLYITSTSFDPVRVELVQPRKESYYEDSRKPDVVRGSLEDDVYRRDFTINTLMADLHSLDVVDITGHGISDLLNRALRTPTDPDVTFFDDPLRMLRALRFMVRFSMQCHPDTWDGILRNNYRLKIISQERIREELLKMFRVNPALALELLRNSSLIQYTALEPLSFGIGMSQTRHHVHDVWNHTLNACTNVIDLGNKNLPGGASDELIMAAMLHDVGKPSCRTIEEDGAIHFYGHADAGMEISRDILQRLKFSNAFVDRVCKLVSLHMRTPEYNWAPRSYRKLALAAGDQLHELLLLMKADSMAGNPEWDLLNLDTTWNEIEKAMASIDVSKSLSPLTGQEIMVLLSLSPCATVGEVKNFLSECVINGSLVQEDKIQARSIAVAFYGLEDKIPA